MTYRLHATPSGWEIRLAGRPVIGPLELLDACSVWWGCMADQIKMLLQEIS